VVSHVDAGSVRRWTLVDYEQGPAMELGAQILTAKHRFDLTPEQRGRIGL